MCLCGRPAKDSVEAKTRDSREGCRRRVLVRNGPCIKAGPLARVDSLLTVAYRTGRTPVGADSCSGKKKDCPRRAALGGEGAGRSGGGSE